MISICMPYYNRRESLLRTLESFRQYADLDLEVVICDDRSKEQLNLDEYPFDVNILRISGSGEPRNPCVPINLAINTSKHDIIVLQNPENTHTDPVLYEMYGMHDEHSYVAARCLCTKRGWIATPDLKYCSPVPKGAHYHFCVMFSRELWEKSGGFDEDYRYVQGYDDTDFVWRMARAGAEFKMIDGKTTHYHEPVKWGLKKGRDLFFSKWPELVS